MKKIKLFFALLIAFFAFWAHAEGNPEFLYYWGIGCGHCEDLEKFLIQNKLYDKYEITKKEVRYDQANNTEMLAVAQSLGVPLEQVGTPFFIEKNGDNFNPMIGTNNVVAYFDARGDILPADEQQQPNRLPLYILWILLLGGIWYAVYTLKK